MIKSKLYITKTEQLANDELFLLAYNKVSKERQEKVDALKQKSDKMRSLAAGLLLDYAKRIDGEEIEYNLSHSGEYAICAVSNSPIGCDIQEIKPNMPCDWSIKESYLKTTKEGIAGMRALKVENISKNYTFTEYNIPKYKCAACTTDASHPQLIFISDFFS